MWRWLQFVLFKQYQLFCHPIYSIQLSQHDSKQYTQLCFCGEYTLVSVTVYVPGSTSNCTTVDHILVDTGSTGLRILSSALSTSFINALTSVTVSGNQLEECAQCVSSYLWGTVKKADLYM